MQENKNIDSHFCIRVNIIRAYKIKLRNEIGYELRARECVLLRIKKNSTINFTLLTNKQTAYIE